MSETTERPRVRLHLPTLLRALMYAVVGAVLVWFARRRP